MKRFIVELLRKKAKEIAKNYSILDRDNNYTNEIFSVDKINILSEYTAAVTFLKSSGKKAMAFLFYINAGEGYWGYFFPTDSHILGMSSFGKFKQSIEDYNYEYN